MSRVSGVSECVFKAVLQNGVNLCVVRRMDDPDGALHVTFNFEGVGVDLDAMVDEWEAKMVKTPPHRANPISSKDVREKLRAVRDRWDRGMPP